MPTVSSRSVCSASTSLEPTPSVDIAMPSVVADPQDARVVPGAHDRARRAPELDLRSTPTSASTAAVGLVGVDAGGGVRVAHRRRCSHVATRAAWRDDRAERHAVGGVRAQRAVALDLTDQPAEPSVETNDAPMPTASAARSCRAEGRGAARRAPFSSAGADDHRQRDVARERVRLRRGRSPAAAPRRASCRCARRRASARSPGASPSSSASRRGRVLARVLLGAASRRASSPPIRPAGRRRSIAGVPSRRSIGPLERQPDDRRRDERPDDQRQRAGGRGRAQPRRPRGAARSAAPRAVPACSATSKALRSSGSSSG